MMIIDEWEDIDKCKDFFDNFAKENNFDPNVAENWYSVNFDSIVAQVFFHSFLIFLIIINNS